MADVIIIILNLGRERYGVDARQALEIIASDGVSPVPGAPPVWAGLANVRGDLYPVLDLHRCLDLPFPRSEGSGKVLLVSGSAMAVGLLVDDARGVARISPAAIGPPLRTTSGAASQGVRGVTRDLVSVLDIDALSHAWAHPFKEARS